MSINRRAVLVNCCSIASAWASEPEAPDPWLADLRLLLAQIPQQHVNAFKWITREQFEQHAARIGNELAGLDADGKALKFAELVASLGDGHSFVSGYFPILGFAPLTYPIRLYAFVDGIHVIAAARSHARLLGARLLRVNRQPVADVYGRVAKLFPAENEMSEQAWTVYGLTAPEVLRTYGAMQKAGPAVFEFSRDGQVFALDLASTEREQPAERFGQVLDPDWLPARTAKGTALRRMNPGRAYWYSLDEHDGSLFVQVNELRNSGPQGVLAFFSEVARVAATQRVDRFVLDLRWNSGGETGMNSTIIKTLLASPVINRKDRFFVLIGRRTFSSAQLICTALEQYSQAIFVGERSGIRTHFFANTRKKIHLSHSQLDVFLSTTWWQPTNAKDLQPGQAPQIAALERFEDFALDRDPALLAALAHPAGD